MFRHSVNSQLFGIGKMGRAQSTLKRRIGCVKISISVNQYSFLSLEDRLLNPQASNDLGAYKHLNFSTHKPWSSSDSSNKSTCCGVNLSVRVAFPVCQASSAYACLLFPFSS